MPTLKFFREKMMVSINNLGLKIKQVILLNSGHMRSSTLKINDSK